MVPQPEVPGPAAPHRTLPRVRLAGAVTAALVALWLLPGAAVAERAGEPAPESAALVEVLLPDRAALDRLVATGTDLAEDLRVTEGDGGLLAYAVVTPSEMADLRTQGFLFGRTVETEANWAAAVAEREATLAAKQAAAGGDVGARATTPAGAVSVLRADYFVSAQGEFLSVEARGADADAALTVRWDAGPGTEPGSGGSTTLAAFVDAGVYLYHRRQVQVQTRPARIEVVDEGTGATAAARTREWLPLDPDGQPTDPYLTDFVDRYMDPTELDERIRQLHAEFPELTEIITLPHQTNGYRRKAQALLGADNAARVAVTSRAWGHQGGNDLSVELRDPAAAGADLDVSVDGGAIVVSLATDPAGAVTSTAAEVAAAIGAEPAATALVEAHTYRGDPGAGVVAPTDGPVALTDFLNAPESVSREPFAVTALRIGKHRDGSRTGVLGYAQEHAREWVTPLVVVETAERLLRNYAHDRDTRRLVDNLDIFLVPSVNPDGSHYSFYDFNFQRRTMTNHCPQENGDPLRRNAWGVDTNRNYPVGSLFDGYSGASTSCVSDVYAGPAELSEPESRNVAWLPQTYPNIRFSMNIHSFGNYFMWSPGAYQMPGRVTLPRPDFGTEAFFWVASEQILTAIKASRGTVVTPARTGPIADVLYSAAGNSGDMLYYDYGIFAWNFEVGDAGFQPPFADEGHAQAMEFAGGLVELLRVAHQWSRDRTAPTTRISPRPGVHRGPVQVTFTASEPVTIYYTLDGSRPTLSSPTVQGAGVRAGAAPITIDRSTTIRWFSVDAAGNVERGYDPDTRRNNYRKATFVIRR